MPAYYLEIAVVVLGLVLLLAEAFTPPERKRLIGWAAVAGLGVVWLLLLTVKSHPDCDCSMWSFYDDRRLSLSYGANPLVVAKMERFEEMIELAREAALHQGFVKKGDIIVVTAGEKGLPGKTNTLRVVEV